MQDFNRTKRIFKSSDFKYILKNGNKYKSRNFIIISHKKNKGPTRLGIIVSKKVGGAVTRNYLKRIFREIFRVEYQYFDTVADIIVILKKNAVDVDFFKLRSEFIGICKRL